MILKEYQENAVSATRKLYEHMAKKREAYENLPEEAKGEIGYMNLVDKEEFHLEDDQPRTGAGNLYPRTCIKIPTGGGKTLVAVKSIQEYQNTFAEKSTGLVVWITHRSSIYQQTINKLQDKTHYYRQVLDQVSNNKTLIKEKGEPIQKQDVEENLVVLMLMIQSTRSNSYNKIFQDSGGYADFFPAENEVDKHAELIKEIPNLDIIEDNLFSKEIAKTSLGNVIRSLNPFIVVDEFHTAFTKKRKEIIDSLNPAMVLGLSATPKKQSNILFDISGRALEEAEMIKLDLHLHEPSEQDDWRAMVSEIKKKREDLENEARNLEKENGTYIRPIALIQVERTGTDQRGKGFVHSEDVREYLHDLEIPPHEVAVKSSIADEIKEEQLLQKESEIRYIITKEALKEGWDCSFAYILGVIPNANSASSMTQLVGRVLRQPYARKTNVKSLDESYVFYAKGQTQSVLENVQKGFDQEGLGDLRSSINSSNEDGEPNEATPAKIKEVVLDDYEHSLVLPVWLIKSDDNSRKLSFSRDINQKVSWQDLDLDTWISKIAGSVTESRTLRREYILGIDKEYEISGEMEKAKVEISAMQITRRIYEIIENSFLAKEIADRAVEVIEDKLDDEVVSTNAGLIVKSLASYLEKTKKEKQKEIFMNMIQSKEMILAVSDQEDKGFKLPIKDYVKNGTSAYNRYLYESFDPSELNNLEKKVANLLDANTNVLWWVRNRVTNGWYSVQGWQKHKIRPDFIVAKKDQDGDIDLLYVIESKGEQLMGNKDTEYKKEVFEEINKLQEKIENLGYQISEVELNDDFDFEVVPQDEEEMIIKNKLS